MQEAMHAARCCMNRGSAAGPASLRLGNLPSPPSPRPTCHSNAVAADSTHDAGHVRAVVLAAQGVGICAGERGRQAGRQGAAIGLGQWSGASLALRLRRNSCVR